MSDVHILLLTIAAVGSGWLLRDWFSGNAGKRVQDPGLSIPPGYVKGLNFLLDQQHDKAVDTFVELFKVNSDTVETHIILGNLFRQRGEIEKAIHIHQNVIAKSRLSNYHHATALLELARDYFDAGLLDRAEKLLKKVLARRIEAVDIEAYGRLIILYEVEKNWKGAIAAAHKLQKLARQEAYNTNIAHYYCELAEAAVNGGSYGEADKYLSKAESLDEASLRMYILRGDIELKQNRYEEALKYYRRAFERHPDFAVLLLPKMQEALGDISALDFSDYINGLKPSILSVTYLKACLKAMLQADLEQEADLFFQRLIKNKQASISILSILLKYKINERQVNDADLIRNVIASLRSHSKTEYTYQCSNCGFQSCTNYWRCPSCNRWDMVMPCDLAGTAITAGDEQESSRTDLDRLNPQYDRLPS